MNDSPFKIDPTAKQKEWARGAVICANVGFDEMEALRAKSDFLDGLLSSGAGRIAIERHRQIHAKGFSADHDDAHTDQAMAGAAMMILYDLLHGTHSTEAEAELDPDATWQEKLAAHVQTKYGADCPANRTRRLAIAGALIAAEIDRLSRDGPTPSEQAGSVAPEGDDYGV